MEKQQVGWRITALGAGAAASAITQMGLRAVWRRAGHREPPDAGGPQRSSWSTALVWAVASGVGTAVARLVAQRASGEAWRAATGSYPPGQPDPA